LTATEAEQKKLVTATSSNLSH